MLFTFASLAELSLTRIVHRFSDVMTKSSTLPTLRFLQTPGSIAQECLPNPCPLKVGGFVTESYS